jgi:RHS repeat-associated protein
VCGPINVIAELNATGATVREYIYLPEAEIAPTRQARTQVDRPIAVISGVATATPATLFVHVDHLNRPTLMTNAAKASVWAAIWTPWGTPQSLTGTEVNDARFPGQWFQLEAGLAYNWHRHYDPSLGRYTQPDPLGFVDGPSVYAYASGNPLIYADASGLMPGGGGERGASGGSSGRGTPNPYKHCKDHPDDPTKIICKDHQTGKTIIKPKPKDWEQFKSKFTLPSCGKTCQMVIMAIVTTTSIIMVSAFCAAN